MEGNYLIYDYKGPGNSYISHCAANGRGCLFQRIVNGRGGGGRGSGGPASHTHTFPDLVPPGLFPSVSAVKGMKSVRSMCVCLLFSTHTDERFYEQTQYT